MHRRAQEDNANDRLCPADRHTPSPAENNRENKRNLHNSSHHPSLGIGFRCIMVPSSQRKKLRRLFVTRLRLSTPALDHLLAVFVGPDPDPDPGPDRSSESAQ